MKRLSQSEIAELEKSGAKVVRRPVTAPAPTQEEKVADYGREIRDALAASQAALIEQMQSIVTAISNMPAPVVNVPEMKIPEINIPEIRIPEVRVPRIEIPEIRAPAVQEAPVIRVTKIRMHNVRRDFGRIVEADFDVESEVLE